MNTPAHVIFGVAAFGASGSRAVTTAAIIGGFLPDLPLMVMVGWSIWVRNIPPQTVFDNYYFSDQWQAVFRLDHGFFVWGGALLLGLLWRSPVLTAFAGSGFLHAFIDFLVHHDDARAQFWPLSAWKFHSPVSYWDRAHYGQYFGPLEIVICLGLSILLWQRYQGVPARVLIGLIALAEVAPGLMFAMMHNGGPK